LSPIGSRHKLSLQTLWLWGKTPPGVNPIPSETSVQAICHEGVYLWWERNSLHY